MTSHYLACLSWFKLKNWWCTKQRVPLITCLSLRKVTHVWCKLRPYKKTARRDNKLSRFFAIPLTSMVVVHENLGLENAISCFARCIAAVKDNINPCKYCVDTSWLTPKPRIWQRKRHVRSRQECFQYQFDETDDMIITHDSDILSSEKRRVISLK